MLFAIKKYYKINNCDDFKERLYSALTSEYADSIFVEIDDSIKMKAKSKIGLFYNSFEPDVSFNVSEAESTLIVDFCLSKKTRILCLLLWCVAVALGIVSLSFGEDVLLTIVTYLSFIILSYIFAILGLFLNSIKYMRFIKGILAVPED